MPGSGAYDLESFRTEKSQAIENIFEVSFRVPAIEFRVIRAVYRLRQDQKLESSCVHGCPHCRFSNWTAPMVPLTAVTHSKPADLGMSSFVEKASENFGVSACVPDGGGGPGAPCWRLLRVQYWNM